MKLKNIIIALGVLVAFSACSKDDDSQEQQKGKANLSIKVANKTISKAEVDPYELPGEANINNLAAFVFNATTLEGIGGKMETLNNVSHEYEMTGIPAESGADPVMIVLVANAPAAAMSAVRNYADLQTALAQLSDQKQSNLTMSTQVITSVFPLDEGDNYIGFGAGYDNINNINEPLWLTRLPARLEVTGISTKFTRAELLGRKVTINGFYYRNVKNESHYFSVADWGIVQVDEIAGSTAATLTPGVEIDNDNPATDLYYYNYVMENLGPENPTGIVVSATLAASEDGKYQPETKFFVANINNIGGGGVRDGINVQHRFIKRNFVYRITMAFGDNAFDGTSTDPDPDPDPDPIIPDPDPDPDPTVFNVFVEVAGWGEVDQPVVID